MTLEELERYFYQAIVDDYQQAWDKLRRQKRCLLWEHVVAQSGAGVGTALLRFWTHTKNDGYFRVLEFLAKDTFRKHTVFPSLFRGISEHGNFLLDI